MAIISGGNEEPGAQHRVKTPFDKTGPRAGYGDLWAHATYNFATQGGALGTIPLMGLTLPSGSIIMGGYVLVTTPPTSGGAGTLAIQIEAANDLVTAAAVSGAPWSSAGLKSVAPSQNGATMIKTTAVRDISAVIATAALTAGLVEIFINYHPPADQ